MFFMPMLIGAALGGGVSALRGGNPLTGALLGAAGGALGGATGLLGGASGATTAGTAAGATGGGFAGGGYGSLGLAGQTALQGAGSGAASGFLGNTMTGIGKDFNAIGNWAKQNPMDALQLGGVAMNTVFPPAPPMPQVQSAGIMRGQMIQQQPMQYAMPRPQFSLI